jgi:hypothetical protein
MRFTQRVKVKKPDHASTGLSINSFFMHIKSTTYKLTKKLQNRVKQRLFHVNAMRPKGGAYFAQHERVSSRPTDYFRFKENPFVFFARGRFNLFLSLKLAVFERA